MTKWIDSLGIGFIVYGALQLALLVAVGLLFVLALGGVAVTAPGGDPELAMIMGFYAVFLLIALVIGVIFSIPYVLVGTALRRRQPWARIGAFVLAVMALWNQPIGTILGVCALVVLLDKDVATEFES